MNTQTTAPTLSPHYTARRPIRHTTVAALDVLHPAELLWVMRAWLRFEGGAEDCDYNVICELTTPVTQIRVWIVDRDGPDSSPMLMLPSDY